MDVDQIVEDREGTRVHIRRVERAEIPALLSLDQAIVREGRGVVLHPDEVCEASTEANFDRLERAGEEDAALLGAFVGFRLVANAEVCRMDLMSIQHAGELTIGVHPKWQGRGIGRLMLTAALEWSDSVGIERLELTVLADNHRAIQMYQSAGFVHEGTRRGAFRFEDGRIVDDLIMARCHF